jgi:hypothetical protein
MPIPRNKKWWLIELITIKCLRYNVAPHCKITKTNQHQRKMKNRNAITNTQHTAFYSYSPDDCSSCSRNIFGILVCISNS